MSWRLGLLFVSFSLAACDTGEPRGPIDDALVLTCDEAPSRAMDVLETYCVHCHSGVDPSGDFVVLDRAYAIGEGLIVPGDPDASPVFHRPYEGQMPPRGEPLRPSGRDVAVLRKWILCGAHMEDADGGMPNDAGRPCGSQLVVEPSEAWAEPTGLVSFQVRGGTGDVRFSLESGAIGRVHETLGVYVAGESESVETVRVVDQGCDGEATAIVHVAPPLHLAPEAVEVTPMSMVELEITGGSGDVELTMVRAASGGTVDAEGRYVAGALEGRDLVRAFDRKTRATSEVTIDVRVGAGVRVTTGLLGLPVGSRFALPVEGGSGRFDVTSDNPAIADVDEGDVRGLTAGRTALSFVDHFTGATTRLAVEVLASASEGTTTRAGDALEMFALASDDIDGDGHVDVVFGHPDSDFEGIDSGAVFVYRGGASGIGAAPFQILRGAFRGHRFGASVALGDLTGDGLLDLVVGAPRADGARTTSGLVSIHAGRGDGGFAEEPSFSLSGPILGDELGAAIALCDFNADGALDVAAGALEAEDLTGMPVAASQGAVYVFLGRSDGRLPAAPDQAIYGRIPAAGGAFEAKRATRLGGGLAAGDVDGDGVCDLAAQMLSPWAAETPARSSDGAVFVHRGVAATEETIGGLELVPARAIVGAPRGTAATVGASRFGASLRVADLDGDAHAEVIVGQPFEDIGSRVDAGAVRIYSGLPAAVTFEAASSASKTIEGTRASGLFGRDVVAAYIDGDARLDLVVGSPLAELATTTADAGVLEVLRGAGARFGFTVQRSVGGVAAGDRLGQLVVAIDDVDGDGQRDLVSHAFLDDRHGIDVGSLHVARSEDGLVALQLPGVVAGGALGRGLGVVGDVLGNDGFPELVVGGEGYDATAPGRNAGRVLVYRGTATGFALTTPVELGGYPGHAAADQLGNSIASLGRFDGADAIADFAVVARNGDRPGTFAAASFAPESGTNTCGSAVSNGGAVHVFRGVASGAISKPAFIYYLPGANTTIEQVAGGFDLNGDGYGDLVVSTRLSDVNGTDSGSFAVIFGDRAPDPSGKTVIVCAPDLLRDGDVASLHLGSAITGVPDIDGDGCDELAVGARQFSPAGQTNAGAVELVFGWRRAGDTSSCATTPRIVRLSAQIGGGLAGSSVAGGDFDGDGRGDLVVGAPQHRISGSASGRVYLARGSYLATLASASGVQPLLDPTAPGLVIDGGAAGDELGASVAFVAGASGMGRDGIAVGAPGDSISGTRGSGSVRVHRVSLAGGHASAEARPMAILSGETERRGSRHGDTLRAARVGSRSYVLVGAPLASEMQMDWGAAFALAVMR